LAGQDDGAIGNDNVLAPKKLLGHQALRSYFGGGSATAERSQAAKKTDRPGLAVKKAIKRCQLPQNESRSISVAEPQTPSLL
jgi:hypothetical protein